MNKEFTTSTIVIEIKIDLEVDFYMLNSRIFTTTDLSSIAKHFEKKNGKKYLCISVESSIDNFDSIAQASAHARPRQLIILGILTFLTQELFSIFDIDQGHTSFSELKKTKISKFRFNKKNYSNHITRIIEYIEHSPENDRRLFFSLIDRYRKAYFFEKESEKNMLYDDEILLSYFHILELLSSRYYPKQKEFGFEVIDQFTKKMLRDVILLEENQIESELKAKAKDIERLFISDLSVTSKIVYMFQEQGLLTDRLRSFISNLVKDRNSVAHGRQVYQEQIIFPLPPFFPIIKNADYTFDMLRILTGRAISVFVGLKYLEKEWNELDQILMPSLSELKLFIKEKKYKELIHDDFYLGRINNINPYTVTHYLLNKKILIDEASRILYDCIINYRSIEEEILQIIHAVVLIVDISSDILWEKCVEIIHLASKNKWIKMREVLYYLEYLGHEPKVLRDMLINNEIE